MIAIVECPSRSLTTFIGTSAASANVAHVCRRSWNRITGTPAFVAVAVAVTVTSLVALMEAFTTQIVAVEASVDACFRRHRDAAIYLSQPGLAVILGGRLLGEFGDDPDRYTDARARKNYAGTSPITRAPGKKTVVIARYARNDRLADAVQRWAQSATVASPGARAYYDALRGRGTGHQAALRQLGNRLVGILHGCLKTGTCYDEHTAWAHRSTTETTTAA